MTIELPSLKERSQDIVILAQRFLAFFSARHRRQFQGFSEEALKMLKAHAWPGNVRELRNCVERAAIVCLGPEVGAADLGLKPDGSETPVRVGDPVSLDKIEEAHIRQVLALSKSLDEAARTLGIDAATLWRRRKKYGI